MKNYSLEELQLLTLKWSEKRKILSKGSAETQLLKALSEIGEFCNNVAMNDLQATKDDIGDCIVCLINIAYLLNRKVYITYFNNDHQYPDMKLSKLGFTLALKFAELGLNHEDNKYPQYAINDICGLLTLAANTINSTIQECWNVAYEDIKDRKGYLNENGNFIKEDCNLP